MSAKNANDLKGKTGLTRLINATRYSKQGFQAVWKTEQAFRQEAILALILVPVAIFLPVAPIERLFLIATIFLVLIVEIINSAIEAVVDRFGPEIHPLSGKAKDLGSAAVLLALILCGLSWATILCELFLA